MAENTYGKKIPATPSDGTRRTIPPGRFAEQTEPVKTIPDTLKIAAEGRLQQSVSVGKKGETRSADARNIESLRPSDDAKMTDED